MKAFKLIQNAIQFIRYLPLKRLSYIKASEHEDIFVVIGDFSDESDEKYKIVTGSLDMLKAHDPRRLSLIKREIDFIYVGFVNGNGSGSYHAKTGICSLEFEIFSKNQQLMSAFIGGIIVHEATHGRLHSMGFEYTTENCIQIERICTAEENRFYKRMEILFPDLQGRLVKKFNPELWLNQPARKSMGNAMKERFAAPHQDTPDDAEAAQDGADIKPVVRLTSGLDDNGSPVDRINKVSVDGGKVYIHATWNNLIKGKTYKCGVRYYDSYNHFKGFCGDYEITDHDGYYEFWCRRIFDRLLDDPGTWRLELYVNGIVVQEIRLKVKRPANSKAHC